MKKIMIVDDEPDQIFTLKTMLESEKDEYELVGVEDGSKCLQLLKKGIHPILSYWTL